MTPVILYSCLFLPLFYVRASFSAFFHERCTLLVVVMLVAILPKKSLLSFLMMIEIGAQCVANYSLVPGAPPVAYISKGG